jgi:hypothetical protein
LGPCGLYCGKCFAYYKGPIKHYSDQLHKALGNFEPYAKRFVSLVNEPVFKQYRAFDEVLVHLSKGICKGCRKDECKLFKGCMVKECSRSRGVDFCFKCPDYPCKQTGFDANLQDRWISINNRMREIGVENYFNEIKKNPRY